MEKGTNLYFTFADLEKAHGELSRELVYQCLCKRNVLKKLIKLVQATYESSKATVRNLYGQTKAFEIKVGLHQGSTLWPFLLILILDTLSECFREGTPQKFLFANGLLVIPESEKELQEIGNKEKQHCIDKSICLLVMRFTYYPLRIIKPFYYL